MVKVISNITSFIPKTHIIEIEVNYSEIEEISEVEIAASNKIPKIKQYTQEELEDKFTTFSLNVLNYISDRDFIIEDNHPSNRDGSLSYYITFYPKDEDGNIRDKFLIFLRLSDHSINNLSKRSRNYHKRTAAQFKRSDDKTQKYMFENIVVDGIKCKGFASALDKIYDILDDMEDGSYFE